MEKFLHAKEVISSIRKKTDTVLLFYSAGKDSICLLDLLSKEFTEIICVFMYFVKDLEHTNRFIHYSQKKYLNVKFIQVPHWTLSRIHRSGMFCQPRKVRLVDFSDVVNTLKYKTGIDYAFIGEKKADNMARNIKLRQYDLEAISTTKNVYPLSKLKDADILDYNKRNKLPQAISYNTKKRSVGVGFNEDVFLYLREFYPADLQKIYDVYPASQTILFKHDQKLLRNGKETD